MSLPSRRGDRTIPTYEELISLYGQQGYHILPIDYSPPVPPPVVGVPNYNIPQTGLIGQDPNSPGYSPITYLPGGEWSSPASPGGFTDPRFDVVTPTSPSAPSADQEKDWLEKIKANSATGTGLSLTTLGLMLFLQGGKNKNLGLILMISGGGLASFGNMFQRN